jgi:MoxR-like ATPase
VTILSGGHALLVGVPGLAKTKLVETLGIVLGLDAKRIQFTPDLMPSDILGAEVLEESVPASARSASSPGPVFAQLLMADEINRASPRTQSALLQAMQEQHVTVAGARHDCRSRSTCWRRRTRSSRKAPIRCRSAARPLPDADRRRLSRSRRRAAHPVRNHRRRRDARRRRR